VGVLAKGGIDDGQQHLVGFGLLDGMHAGQSERSL
jgi:hypothetical protein